MNHALLVVLVSVAVWWSLPPPAGSETVEIKSAAKANESPSSKSLQAANDGKSNNSSSSSSSTPCDRYLRSAEVEVRNPRNHKFVTSNGWERHQRPRPEINVYSRIEEQPSPPPPSATAAYYQQQQQQQQDGYYYRSRQQPQTVRTSKRIIYYATLPDVVRPNNYPVSGGSGGSYATDPFALGPGPFSADFRQLDFNRNGQPPSDNSQRNRLVTPYDNNYNRGNGVTSSVTSTSSAVYNSRYDEPAEFRDSFYRPNEFASKFSSWSEPFYKGFSWDKGGPSSSWDREPLSRGSGGAWTRDLPNRGSAWNAREPFNGPRGTPWEKDLVEVPLQKPNGRNSNINNDSEKFPENKYPEVAVVQSGVIDVRGDRSQNGPPPPPRFTIIDVDPKPYQQPSSMRGYDDRMSMMQKPMRYEQQPPAAMEHTRYEQHNYPMAPAYRPMMQPARYEQQQPSPVHYEQQQRMPPSSSWSSSSTRYGHHNHQNTQQQPPPSNGYYESIKNNINTHQFMTSWTEVSTQDAVSPTHSAVTIDISTLGNTTSVQNNTRITPYTNANTTKLPNSIM